MVHLHHGDSAISNNAFNFSVTAVTSGVSWIEQSWIVNWIVRKMTPAHPLIVGQLSCLLLACSLSFCSAQHSVLLNALRFSIHLVEINAQRFSIHSVSVQPCYSALFFHFTSARYSSFSGFIQRLKQWFIHSMTPTPARRLTRF